MWEKIIHALLVKGVLEVATFVKRHPWFCLFLIILLWLIMALEQFLLNVAALFTAKTGIKIISQVMTKAVAWLQAARWRWWALLWALSLISPLVGAFFTLWHLLDHWKPQMQISPSQPSPLPEVKPETQNPDAYFYR